MNTTMNTGAASLSDEEKSEILDWVSACQSAYHIDSTPGHRFGGLGSNLEDNRAELIACVEGIVSRRTTPTPQADAAIAAGGAQEPVAWRLRLEDGTFDYSDCEVRPTDSDLLYASEHGLRFEPLYAAPLPRVAATVGLTDEQRVAIRECIDYLTPAAKQFSDLGMPGMGDSKHARCIRTLRSLLAASNGEQK